MSINFDNIKFKPADNIFSKVKRTLKSFDYAGIIDEGEFPTYTKEVLSELGIAVFKEQRAVIKVQNGKAVLPKNFKFFSGAFKCEVDEFTWRDKQNSAHLQSSFSFERDVTQEWFLDYNDTKISCRKDKRNMIESVSIKSTLYTKADATFNRIIPLHLSKFVDKELLADENIVINAASKYHEISIDNNYIYCNFTEGTIYLEFFGIPLDENDQLEIPDIIYVEKAVEWYIIYQILMSNWFNSSVEDIQNRYLKAEQQYQEAFMKAKHYLKFPTFQSMVKQIRMKRSMNKLVFFTSNYLGTNFQSNN